ncbi:glycosyl hydrolase 115 family protein [Caulobacter segnis]
MRTFWRGGIERMMSKGDGTPYESVVTVGMRGDGDEPMAEGAATQLLEKVVTDQRQIIADVTGKPADQTPQVWALYKEVQDYYDHGMRVPDDVTLLFSDDNWGQIRRLPVAGKDKLPRAGGYGVYYHFDYVGGPRNYKWINTNQAAKVWQQMDLAYERGAREPVDRQCRRHQADGISAELSSCAWPGTPKAMTPKAWRPSRRTGPAKASARRWAARSARCSGDLWNPGFAAQA